MRHCDQCEVLFINGIKCHENGCPDSWKDSILDCLWCGTEFKPEENGQALCSDECAADYWS